MTEIDEKIFNLIVNNLTEYDMMNLSNTTEEKKKEVFRICLPAIDKIKKEEDLSKYLEELMLILDINLNGKEAMDILFKKIIHEIKILKKLKFLCL